LLSGRFSLLEELSVLTEHLVELVDDLRERNEVSDRDLWSERLNQPSVASSGDKGGVSE